MGTGVLESTVAPMVNANCIYEYMCTAFPNDGYLYVCLQLNIRTHGHVIKILSNHAMVKCKR